MLIPNQTYVINITYPETLVVFDSMFRQTGPTMPTVVLLVLLTLVIVLNSVFVVDVVLIESSLNGSDNKPVGIVGIFKGLSR